ncbi:hypothetical protein D3C81_2013240 [compost metagenome]
MAVRSMNLDVSRFRSMAAAMSSSSLSVEAGCWRIMGAMGVRGACAVVPGSLLAGAFGRVFRTFAG